MTRASRTIRSGSDPAHEPGSLVLYPAYMRAWRVKKFFRDQHFFSSDFREGSRELSSTLMARQALCLAALSGQPPGPGGAARKGAGVGGQKRAKATMVSRHYAANVTAL